MNEDWEERFNKSIKGKIDGHAFNGSCNYNNNENGQGHLECRHPYNPGNINPSGNQCLKLKEQHFDIKSFIAQEIARAEADMKQRCIEAVPAVDTIGEAAVLQYKIFGLWDAKKMCMLGRNDYRAAALEALEAIKIKS